MVPGLLLAFAFGAPPSPVPLAEAREAHKDAVAKFGVAVWNIRRDRLLTAAKQLEVVAKLDPDATAPLRELVRIYSQLGRETDAIRVAREVIAKDPKDVDTAHALARLLFDIGELKEAIAAAKLAAERPPSAERADKTVAVYRDLATLCEKAGDLAAAEAALRKATTFLTENRNVIIIAAAFTPRETDTAAAECLERLAKVQTKLSKFGDAVESFTLAAKLYADPRGANDAGAATRLGWNLSGVLQAQGEPAAAIKQLEPFLKLKPVSSEPYARLAKLLRAADREAEVIPTLRKFVLADAKNLPLQVAFAAELARDPTTRDEADTLFATVTAATNDQRIVDVVVRSHLDTQRPSKIVADLDKAFAALKDKDEAKDEKPVTAETAAIKAFAAAKAEAIAECLRPLPEAAVAVLEAATADIRAGTKRTHQVYYFLAQLAARHGKIELAAHHFQNAVRNAPRETTVDAYSGLIDVLRIGHKHRELADVCQAALRNIENLALAPHYFNYYLAGALAELGDEKAALAAADAAIQQTAAGDRLTVRLNKVYILSTLGKWDAAIELGKKLSDEFDTPADRLRIRYAVAAAYWGAKKPTEGEAELRAILDADPDHAGACNQLGFHLADAGRDLEEAERLIRHALSVDKADRRKAGNAEPENAGYVDSLGWVLFRRGKLPEARAELERAAALYSGATSPVIWDHLGDVWFRQGEKVKAKVAWEKAEKLYEADAPGTTRGRRDGRLDELKRKLKRL